MFGWKVNQTPYNTAISRPGGYEVKILASNMPKSQKIRKPLQAKFSSLCLSNQKEILKRGITWTEQKPKGTTFKVQSIAISNPLYIDLIHQWQPIVCLKLYNQYVAMLKKLLIYNTYFKVYPKYVYIRYLPRRALFEALF